MRSLDGGPGASVRRARSRIRGAVVLLLAGACHDPGAPAEEGDGPPRFAHIAAGSAHFCALTDAGTPYCWGSDTYGAVTATPNPSGYDPTGVDRPTRPALPWQPLPRLDAVAAGWSRSCAVAEGGAAYCWGYTLFAGSASGEVAASRVPGGPWREIATGFSHACALTTDGVAYCWGGGANGQLGTGRVESSLGEPTRVATSLRFAHLAAGSAHTCALTTDGAVYCWGDNGGGQLGAASGADCRTASSRPVPLPCALAPQPVESAVRFASIAAGGSATCALTAAGVTWCWGATLVVRAVRTGPGPLRVEGAPAFVSLALGPSHGCGLTADGAAYCWGTNTSGELGLGYASPPGDAIGVLEPTPVVGGHRFRALAAADVATCGIDASGELYCWGNDVFGTLGAGRTSAERCINGVPCSTSPMWAALPTSPGGGAAGRG